MAKNDKITVQAPATSGKVRKNTPKVTNVQKRMTKEQQDAWFNEHCTKLPAETQAIIHTKLSAPLTVRNASSVKAYDAEWAKSLSVMQVMSAKTVIDAEFKVRKGEFDAERAKIRAEIAERQALLAAAPESANA